MRLQYLSAACAALILACAGPANAAEDASCQQPRFSDIGWTDISVTTAMASTILEGLGYQPTSDMLGLDITYKSMQNKDIDIFLGSWAPGLSQYSQPYYDDKSIETVAVNLTGTKWTWAVPDYVYQAGVKSFADLDKHRDQFEGKIYGTEPGGNKQMEQAIAEDAFGLGDWSIVESSEAGMLSQVMKAVQNKKWIIFVAWQPHPMNRTFKIDYLSDGDKFYGANFGASTVSTDVRAGYMALCPNITALLRNLKFDVPMENLMMDNVLNDSMSPKDAALKWLKANPAWLEKTVGSVSTFDGQPGLAAVKSHLGM